MRFDIGPILLHLDNDLLQEKGRGDYWHCSGHNSTANRGSDAGTQAESPLTQNAIVDNFTIITTVVCTRILELRRCGGRVMQWSCHKWSSEERIVPRRTEPKRVSAASAERTGFDRFPYHRWGHIGKNGYLCV